MAKTMSTGPTEDVKITNGMMTITTSGTYSVDLVIVGDQFVESSETYTVEIVPANSLDNPGATQSFTVTDDDGKCMQMN